MAEPSQHGGGPTAPRINNVRLFSRLLGSSSSSSSSAHRKWGSNDDGDDVRPPRTRKNDDNGRRRHRRDSDDGGGGGSSAVSDPGDSADEDSSGMFEVCETVDDSMFGLHRATIDGAAVAGSDARVVDDADSFEYDWILDGSRDDDDSEGGGDSTTIEHGMRRRRRRRAYPSFGDPALDRMLGLMEMELSSASSSSTQGTAASGGCASVIPDDGPKQQCTTNTNEEEGGGGAGGGVEEEEEDEEEVIEFADFSRFGSEEIGTLFFDGELFATNEGNARNDVPETQRREEEEEENFGHFFGCGLPPPGRVECRVDSPSPDYSQPTGFRDCDPNEARNDEKKKKTRGNDAAGHEPPAESIECRSDSRGGGIFRECDSDGAADPGYEPPESIARLVSSLDAGLDEPPPRDDDDEDNRSVVVVARRGSDDSYSRDDDDDDDDDDDEGDCSTLPLLRALGEEEGDATTAPPPTTSGRCRGGCKPQPSLLMSALLLETLPAPMPSGPSEDPLGTFTRRIQKCHAASREAERDDAAKDANIEIRAEDEVLEGKLSDTIHRGYFGGAGDDRDGDYFDPIVMEEILNVPWPFHVIDLNESFLSEEIDMDSDDSVDHLNFDTYISNRLTELNSATDEIMSCMRSRVGRKSDAVRDGVETVFAAEMEVSTALLYAKSSREILRRAKDGYELPSTQNDRQVGRHDAVSGALDVVRYAESKDRLRHLLDTADQMSSICDREARWWKDVDSKTIAPHRFEKLLVDTRRLKDMVQGEELLSHATSLAIMKDRLKSLPHLLHERVEDSLADLFSRALSSNDNNPLSFDEYLFEFDSLANAWLSCFQMMTDNNAYVQQSQLSVIEVAWSGCILKLFCFEASKAVAFSMIGSRYEERTNSFNEVDRGELDQIQELVSQMKDISGLESLSHRLLKARLSGGHHNSAMSSIFFHLASRLVEVMSLYDLILQWLKELVDKVEAAHEPNACSTPECTSVECEMSHSTVSLLSSDKHSSSSLDEESNEEAPIDQTSSPPVPENLVFMRHPVCTTLDQFRAIHKSVNVKHIRRALWKKCEVSLINLIELCMLHRGDTGVQFGDSTDFCTENLRLTHDVLLQFTSFSSYFLGDDDEDGNEQCSSLKSKLSELYQRHLRSVHIEAMKTTGTLLEHEAWQLAPLELPGKAVGVESDGDNWTNETVVQSVYQAVEELILGSSPETKITKNHIIITKRAEDHGYRHCGSFRQYLDRLAVTRVATPKQDASKRRLGHGIKSKEFISTILQFVEIKPCGVRTFSILTQSSSNGLLRWASRLLAIGHALPLVAGDASAAVTTLFDLYILTVFRFCTRNKSNEDVLIGFGRGTATSSSVSLTIEADAAAPLPREGGDFVRTQEFINCSRERLKHIVSLDKFQATSSYMSPTCPRSKNAVSNYARRLEKEAAAACSCFFVAILVDVASAMYSDRQDQPSQKQPLWANLKDMATSIEKDEDISGLLKNEYSLETYAISLVAIVPRLVTQATRYATVNSLSGKELIFQIICCGREWETPDMKEQPNSFVDDLCERSAHLWGCMSSSTRLPPSALHFTWNELIRSAFMLLLEGFSKVVNCSTEGRSLMSMDLATLSHGFIPEIVQAEVEDDYPNIGTPPQAYRDEMMQYVDKYIKVFYFPNEDIVNWIKDNSGDYHLDHSLSLVTAKAAGSRDKAFMTDGKKAVAAIYDDKLS